MTLGRTANGLVPKVFLIIKEGNGHLTHERRYQKQIGEMGGSPLKLFHGVLAPGCWTF